MEPERSFPTDEGRAVLRALAAERGWHPDDDQIDRALARYEEIADALRPLRNDWLGPDEPENVDDT